MVPQPTKTIAPRASIAYTTVAPLTTIFTPPATCSTAALTLFGGSCSGSYCTAYSPDQITRSWNAAINYVYWNSLSQMVGSWETACAPPGSQLVGGFYFSPAVGCPVGYTTATAVYSSEYGSFVSYISRGNSMSAICCPSAYSSIQKLSAGDWGCYSTMSTPGQRMIVVAHGRSTSYDAFGATFYYNSISTISTTTISALPTGAATHLWVYAAAVAMVVSTGAVTPATTSNAYGATATPAFHLGPLSMITSISIVASSGLVVLLILGSLCVFCCRRSSRRPTVAQRPIPFQSYQPPPTMYSAPPVSNTFQRPIPPVYRSVPDPSQSDAMAERLRRAQQERDRDAAKAREQALDVAKVRRDLANQLKKNEEETRRKREIADKKRRSDQLAERKAMREAEIAAADKQRKRAAMKRDPLIRCYRIKVAWEALDEPSYKNMFDQGPTYGAPYFKVEGKTSLPQRRLSERRRLTGLALPVEQADSPVSPSPRPAASQAPAPKRPNEHLPYNGPKLQVSPGGTTLNTNSASSPQLTTSAQDSKAVPSLAAVTSSGRHDIPRKPTTSAQMPGKSPAREEATGRGSRNTLPRDKPNFVVNVGGDTFEDRDDIPARTGATSSPAPETLEEALLLEILRGRR